MTAALGLVLALMAADWLAVATRRPYLEAVAKPGALLLLALWFWAGLPTPAPPMGLAVLAALGASLAGDILLLPALDRFVAGLVAFLMAHAAYVVAFNLQGIVLTPLSLLLALVLAYVSGRLLRWLRPGLVARGRARLLPAVALYAAALSLSTWSAATALLRPEWPLAASLAAACGGILFYFSDAAVAWNRFLGAFPGGRLGEHVTYHLAQLGLAVGVHVALTRSL